MSTYADVAVAVMADAGVEFIFGVPGSLSSVELIEAASRRDIRYVLCSNEASAAVMAGTYGILTNRPGVCSTGVGPGAAAAVLGVANGFLERAPFLVLTDRYSDEQFRRLQRQRLDQDLLYSPITKGTFKLAKDSAAVTMRRAIALAMDGRQGPVHVDIPYDVMQAEAEASDFPPDGVGARRFAGKIGNNHAGLEVAAAEIARADRPAILVGLQVNRSGQEAEEAFVAFAERLGAPVFASLAAKGTLPENHPLSMRTFRGAPSEKEILDKADLLILVGFDVVELFTPGHWNHPQPVVMLDEVAHNDDVIRPKVEVVADLADSLSALAESVPASEGWNLEDLDSYRAMRSAPLFSKGEGLMPGAVVRIARECLPDSGIMTADAGSHKVLASDTWETRRPRGFLTSSGLGSMAVGLPAAIAAKLVEPQTPVLCLTGDGGFLMRLGDLETAARVGAAIVVVVFNDGFLNLIKIKQDTRNFQRLGTDFGNTDYVAVAQGLGFEATRVDSEAALKEALGKAFASGGAWVIDAVINPDGYLAAKDVRPE
ncbi:MAG: thiamine pyrophosphate-binding protein [Nitrospinaceae bacterium]|jgi:acetolactate synthase I/II/III large subunit|nr:thiamine pyrophosphate-binding protein [Nitrospinaceae bacterium]MBT3432918.1 thiamine pyrophosphate-binding protein [Nitrospinaceae bacterium]MBT4431606.1 thiamine pyrophosphate-binding protein [Nitrospinaceae bacterium]MBT5370049.1 thiamine pyrophosphate-binding protein [Nitrospinaceae bacterium]MBT5948508.1 thiamine pyrophosphate-binding protein [Nitrospinaceae bacterium]